MKKTTLIFALATLLIACQDNNTEKESQSKDTLQKIAETPKKAKNALTEAEMPFAKNWKITEYVMPGAVHEYEGKDYFIDLRNDGSFSCKFIMEEEGKEIKGEGKWKLTNPKPKTWDGKVEGALEPLEIAPNEEVLELTFGKDAPKKYTAQITEGKLYLSIPGWYYNISGVAK